MKFFLLASIFFFQIYFRLKWAVFTSIYFLNVFSRYFSHFLFQDVPHNAKETKKFINFNHPTPKIESFFSKEKKIESKDMRLPTIYWQLNWIFFQISSIHQPKKKYDKNHQQKNFNLLETTKSFRTGVFIPNFNCTEVQVENRWQPILEGDKIRIWINSFLFVLFSGIVEVIWIEIFDRMMSSQSFRSKL